MNGYISGLTTIDMLGVNDSWVAMNGVVISDMPGHERVAPLAYLMRAGDQCHISKASSAERQAFPFDAQHAKAKLLELVDPVLEIK